MLKVPSVWPVVEARGWCAQYALSSMRTWLSDSLPKLGHGLVEPSRRFSRYVPLLLCPYP